MLFTEARKCTKESVITITKLRDVLEERYNGLFVLPYYNTFTSAKIYRYDLLNGPHQHQLLSVMAGTIDAQVSIVN